MSNKGLVKIEFSKKLEPNQNFTTINEDMLNVTIIPNFNQLNFSKLDFTWEVTNFTQKEMIIQLRF